MRFSCARCGQRYSSVDEPRAGLEYRVPCVACGAVLLLKGGDFPAVPAAAPDPGATAGTGTASDAAGEAPLGLALSPMAMPQRAALPRGGPTRVASRKAEPASRRWLRIAAGGGVALATVGAALLLLLGGPSDARPSAASPGSPPTPVPGGAAPSLSPGPPSSPGASPARPAAPAPAPAPDAPGAAALRALPSPPTPAPVAAAPARRGPQPPSRRVAGASSPGAMGAVAPAPPASPGSTAASPAPARSAAPPAPAAVAARAPSPAPSSHSLSEQMVVESLAARRPAFDACVRDSQQGNPGAGLSGRRLTVTLMVSPSGTVSASSIDDPALENTTLGTCLRNVLSRPFPAFEGDPLRLVVPLRLGE